MDFMLEWDLEKQEPKKQSLEEMKAALRGLASYVNRKGKEKKRNGLNLMNRPPKRFRQTKNPGL